MWVKLDDQFPYHPKLASLNHAAPLAIALQVRALCYSSRYLTDGYIPEGVVPFLAHDLGPPPAGAPAEAPAAHQQDSAWAAAMVRVGLWEVRPGGYAIHDYLVYNPSRVQVGAVRAHKRYGGQVRAAQAVRSGGRFATPAQPPAGDQHPAGEIYQQATSTPPAGAPAEHQPVPVPRKTTSKTSGAPKARAGVITWLTPFGEAWAAAYGGKPAYGELAKHLDALVKEHPHGEVLERWERYLDATDAAYANPARFAQTYGAWGKAERAKEPNPWDAYESVDEMERRHGIDSKISIEGCMKMFTPPPRPEPPVASADDVPL